VGEPEVERRVAAERRGWVFTFIGTTVEATLIDVPEDDEHRGRQFVAEDGDALTEALELVEAFDRGHARGA
jgi:hypothetical protein